MRRIDTPDGLYHNADPNAGVPGTLVKAEPLNAVQEEIISVITAAGIELDEAKTNQLLDAILAITGGGSLPWGAITDKPLTYPPSAHHHPVSDIDGFSDAAAGRLLNIAVFRSSNTYAPTPGVRKLRVRMWGGGGGGSGGQPDGQGAGGGGAGYCEAWIDAPPAGTPITVGAGGSGGTANKSGGSGGASSFLDLSCTGGAPGTVGPNQGLPGNGGGAAGGFFNIPGTAGRGSFGTSTGPGQGGAAFGASGGNVHYGAGDAGVAAGGGGAGGGQGPAPYSGTYPGGAGGAGLVILEEYA